MVVIIIETAPRPLRGEITRWMIEPAPGVYVGTMSARVRDRLWDRITTNPSAITATILYTAQTEQGFDVRTTGQPKRRIRDFEGLNLVTVTR
ncbi:MAG: type I-E CRISPR-associated endoribonuclease Cas2 [bacterium]|nr:type I-E CRISPR-associated endoribonuclease Cas2 [bacterium]